MFEARHCCPAGSLEEQGQFCSFRVCCEVGKLAKNASAAEHETLRSARPVDSSLLNQEPDGRLLLVCNTHLYFANFARHREKSFFKTRSMNHVGYYRASSVG